MVYGCKDHLHISTYNVDRLTSGKNGSPQVEMGQQAEGAIP